MPVAQVLSASLEIGINQALNWSFNKDELMAPIIDKTCIVFVQEIEKALVFSFNVNGVTVSIDEDGAFEQNPEDCDNTLLSDNECWVSISIFALEQLKQNSQLTKLIKSGQLDFAGNLTILQSLSKLYNLLDLDIEEILSKYLGDPIAHHVHDLSKKVSSSFLRKLELLKLTISDAALDEKPIAVRGIMVANFCDDVVDLRSRADRLEARLESLENRVCNVNEIESKVNKLNQRKNDLGGNVK